MLESIILEQFIDALPARTSAWVRYHSSPDVKTAVKLAEEHLAVQREATPKDSRKAHPSTPPTTRPAMGGMEETSREQRPRTAEPPGANEQVPHAGSQQKIVPTRTHIYSAKGGTRGYNISSVGAFQGTGAAERGLPSQMAPQTPGPVCWRCGRPGHVRRECSMMEQRRRP
nr:zinc finger protein 444-like [Nerophis lumbriciformis]